MRSKLCFVLAAGAALVLITPVAKAQNAVTDAQNKLLAKRAAEADCFRKLTETVYGLQLNSETTVRDFVTESDQIRTSVNQFIKGIRTQKPTYYDDGVAEVECEVTVANVITSIKQAHSTHYHGNKVTTTDIETISKRIQKDVISAVGSGAPRPDVPPDLPPQAMDQLPPLPQDYTPPRRAIPEIWKSVGPQGRLMAERAARVDALRKLLETIKGLRLNSETLVRDFVTESDEIATRAEGIVVGASEVSTYLHDDELIAEVTMQVPVERVLTKIKELHSEHYHGNRVTATHIENVKKEIERDTVEATGMGVPPQRFLKEAEAKGVSSPDWMANVLQATGQGTDPEMNTAQGKLRAARAAALDGLRKLAEQIYGLRIDSNTTVRDFVTQRDEIRSQVDAVLTGAFQEPATFSEDVATVVVTLPAAEVWSVVNSEIRHERRSGS
ncbi:MAG: LPP20 family lipoprotein [Phycisphaerae bacterium]|nr:LPP20 family lipoprotein [Phycisphaerae bacterium]